MTWWQKTDGGWKTQFGDVLVGAEEHWENVPTPWAQVHQVHGSIIELVDGPIPESQKNADGMVTEKRNLCLVVKTADCVPVHLFDENKIAMVHAGWRGTEAGILNVALGHFPDAKQVQAIIGPCISQEHYEVDRDLYENWMAREPALAAFLKPGLGTKKFLDLRGWIKAYLENTGVKSCHIIPICTYSSGHSSYRRDGQKAGRLKSFIIRLE